MARAGELEVAGLEVEEHVHRGGEGLVGVLAQQEVVGGPEKVAWR